jgi:hypothetical protein
MEVKMRKAPAFAFLWRRSPLPRFEQYLGGQWTAAAVTPGGNVSETLTVSV